MQLLIVSLENQQSSFRQLSDLIQEEHKSAKQHVSKKLDQHRKDREKAEYCSKYLDSLAFPGMRARQELIIGPYKGTFQWVFDDSGKTVEPWGNFVEWLKKGQSIYWIQGKAGSGKSTLMSYIYEDKRTETSLKTWAGAHELLIIPFFFWKAGNDSRMQKTSAGLLRSVLYQILEKVPDLILSIALNYNDPQGFQAGVHGFPSIPAWTERRLLTIFRKLLFDLSSTHHLCLLIDGLDEIDGDQSDLVRLLQERVKGPNIKICLSSRPDPSFKAAFSSPAMLKMEDLTRKDIKKYVSGKLAREWRESPAMDDKESLRRMIDTIVKKAHGVFQWVHIVVPYQIRGLQRKNSLDELLERLDELPEEIGHLYAYMLTKIDKVHRKEVASYLQIILQVRRNPSISELTLALYERRDILFSPQSALPLIEIAQQCALLRQRVTLICGGLLELRERNDVLSEGESKETRLINEENSWDRGKLTSATLLPNAFQKANTTFHQNRTTRVHLIHRSAYDFLKDSQAGKEFVEANIPSTFDVYGSYIEARLAQLVILAQDEDFCHSPSSSSPKSETSIVSPDPPLASLFPRYPRSQIHQKWTFPGPGRYRKPVKRRFEVQIKAIMEFALFFERTTHQAQAALNEKIDKVVTMLDQQYLGEASDTHWCTRWGFPQESSLGTRSNLPLPENIFQNPIVPLAFLCFAAYQGLHLYVLDTIQTRLERDDTDAMTVLLRFTFHGRFLATSCLELVIVLLRQGANPSISSLESNDSVWSFFLKYMVESAEDETLMKYEGQQLASTARTFIESGADVNAKLLSYHTDPFAWIVGVDVSTGLKIFGGAEVGAKMSVLAYIQDAIAHFPGLTEIRELCIARGALWTSKSYVLYLGHRRYDLSQRQSEEMDKIVFAWSCQEAGRPLSLPLESLREILLRLYHELRLDEDDTDEDDTRERVIKVVEEGQVTDTDEVTEEDSSYSYSDTDTDDEITDEEDTD